MSNDDKQPLILLRFKPGPKYDIEVIQAFSPERLSIGLVLKSMEERPQETGFYVACGYIAFRKLLAVDGEPPKVMGVTQFDQRDCVVAIYFKIFDLLPFDVRRELFKMFALRFLHGHYSSRGVELINRYGREIADRAGQMAIAQFVSPGLMAEEGIILPVPEMWNFPKNQSWDTYCELLQQAGNGQGSGMPQQINAVVIDPAAIAGRRTDLTPEQQEALAQALQNLMDNNGLSNISNLDAVNSVDGVNEANEAMRNFLDNVDSVLRQTDKPLKSQGFMHGDGAQFIESFEREAEVPWKSYLRSGVGRHKSHRRRPSRVRPSRRDTPIVMPSGQSIPFYKGRIHTRGQLGAVIVDTSGSMGKNELACVKAELLGIRATGTQLFIFEVDAALCKEPYEFNWWTDVDTWHGRHGTSFEPGFKAVAEMDPQPDIVIYYTDGYDCGVGRLPEPAYPVIWLLTSTGMTEEAFRKQVAWGEIIKISVPAE